MKREMNKCHQISPPYKPPKKGGNSLLIRIIVVTVIAVLIIGSIIAAQKGLDDKFFSFNIGPGN